LTSQCRAGRAGAELFAPTAAAATLESNGYAAAADVGLGAAELRNLSRLLWRR
jgi:hypothetical protein